MGAASRYWRLIKIDATSQRKVEEVASAQEFFRQQFPAFCQPVEVPDAQIQTQLLAWLQRSEPSREATISHLAELCLRCFISSQIEQTCIQLETLFGSSHSFTRQDLFPFVLNDLVLEKPRPSAYRPLATEILQTFDPRRGNLATWTARLVKHHRELNTFLLERGVYLVSDWAILNDTTAKQLRRILSDFHQLTPTEIERASLLLASYHAVYRRDRLSQSTSRGKCPPPNPDQLSQMVHLCRSQTTLEFSAESLLAQLQDLAERLRQYRIYVRGGSLPADSLQDPKVNAQASHLQAPADGSTEDEQSQFLRRYHQEFVHCLDQSVAQVIQAQWATLQGRSLQSAQDFIAALKLFHCQGKSMGEIAQQVGLKAQYQVTRLLKLKSLRADIRQHMLAALRERILAMAVNYTSPDQLQSLDRQVEAALEEQIEGIIQSAEAEASVARNRPLASLFAQRLCRHLDLRNQNL